jgi:hypothetical protein
MRTTELAAVRVVACVLFCAAAWASPARAQDRGLLDHTFVVSLGTYFLDSDTEIGLNGSAGQTGTIVDLEGDTGMDDSNRFRVDGLWRIGGGRHHVRAMWRLAGDCTWTRRASGSRWNWTTSTVAFPTCASA